LLLEEGWGVGDDWPAVKGEAALGLDEGQEELGA
jgi:hypothetical protein